jgi:hypothetical protein
MTIATSDETSVGSSTAAATRPSRFLKRRRWRVDVIGAFALALAVAGLVGTVVFLRTTPPPLPPPYQPRSYAISGTSTHRTRWPGSTPHCLPRR